MIIGGRRRPVLPSIPWTSLPQMPQAFTATRTSSGPGSGAGTSSKENCLYSLSNNAFIWLRVRGYTEPAQSYEKDLEPGRSRGASKGGFTHWRLLTEEYGYMITPFTPLEP